MTRIDKRLAAQKGFSMLSDYIRRTLQSRVYHPDPDRNGLHVVVLDASYPYDPHMATIPQAALLLEESFNEDKWGEARYDNIARGKARISWRTKMSSREVVKLHPELLEPGDAKYAGAVYYHGLVVAVSGVKSYWDEALSMSIAAMVHAFILEAMEEIEANTSVDMIDRSF